MESDTGINRNSIKCKVSQEKEDAYLQRAGCNPRGYKMSCFSTLGGSDSSHTTNQIKNTFFFISPPRNVEKWEGIKSLRWDERTPRGKERERETETKSKRVSCGLNSDQLFKACACSWVWAALIKDAVSEQATDTREGGTPRLIRKGWGVGVEQHHLSGPQQSNKKLLNNNYRASKYYWLSTFSTSYIKSI